jgi:O-antigen ligase
VAAKTVGALVAAALGWALVAKVFPALNEDGGRIARLRLPVGYWNALAILLVIAVPIALWLVSGRERRPPARAAAVLFLYALVLGLLLTYSRGGILAGAIALAVWLALSGRRLESVLALAVALPVAVGVFAVALQLPGVVDDGQDYAVRVSDGRAFGLALLVGALAAFGLAYAVFRLEARRPVTEEARARLARLTGIGLLAVVVAAAIAAGLRAGAFGDWVVRQADEFANPPTVLVTQEAERLTSLSSNNRWTWWNEAWDAASTSPIGGTGAGSFATVHRILREDELTVTEPHSMPLQFLAETGIVGAVLGCVAGVAALVGVFAAVRRVRPGERQAALALAVGILAYVLQSLIDFDWSYIAVTAPVLVATGVLFASGRSPETRRAGLAFVPLAVAVAAAAIIALGAPWLAARRVDDAYTALGEGRARDALAAADAAHSLNPLALDPLVARAAAATDLGDLEAARATLAEAVDLQPLDSDAWYELGAFELRLGGRSDVAIRYLERARELDPFGPAAALLAEAQGTE